jgi:peptidoglycan/xylan/chitin deacetylase (PgdA/CDA1 family)
MTAVPVLLYHGIGEPTDLWTVPPARFEEDVTAVVDSGRTPVTLGDFVARLEAGEPLDGLVVVTFDDGEASCLPAALALAAQGIPCTVYVTATFLGEKGMLDLPSLRDLGDVPGIEIGSHSLHHVRLDELGKAGMRTELAESRARLEDIVQRPVLGVAYPHGCHDGRVKRAARAAGYTSGAGVKNALSHGRDDPMGIARVTVQSDMTGADVRRVLRGEGRLGERRPRLRTRGFRVVRRVRAAISR